MSIMFAWIALNLRNCGTENHPHKALSTLTTDQLSKAPKASPFEVALPHLSDRMVKVESIDIEGRPRARICAFGFNYGLTMKVVHPNSAPPMSWVLPMATPAASPTGVFLFCR
jgi:hypothetical protein